MSDPFGGARLDCDIVMKGGITSGVVYPGAAVELAKSYTFRAIGGTSAGAIAAAIVAAAEHRRAGGSSAGFEAVAGLPDRLGATERPDGTGDLKLLRLFQPDRATAGLFDVMMGFMKHGRRGGALRVPLAFPAGPAAGLAVASASLWTRRPRGVALGVGAGAAIGAAGVAAGVARAVGALPGNDFGLCTLGPGSVGKRPALTEWLHEEIQTTAGRAVDGPVLTIADLWGVDPQLTDPAERRAAMIALSRDPEARVVDLQMMTTDLTHGRPWRLPSPYQPDEDRLEQEAGGLLFQPDELARFFPPCVIRHMAAGGEPISARRAALLPDGGAAYRRFPMGPDLPVLVATRMSLSFPGLISAVPLYNIDFAATPPRLERVLFSDGGISSNFPVHFFDAPLPRRPTFGLHLTSFPAGVTPPVGSERQAAAIVPPPPAEGEAPEEPRDIATLPQFFGAIKDAMQNWRDNAQSRQPGFRDRVVHIMLGAGEGGMTLTMNQPKIADLSARGGEAAKVLVARFAAAEGGAGSAWNVHRFVRFRITMAVAEDFMVSFGKAYDGAVADPTMGYEARVRAGTVKPYALTDGQVTVAVRRAEGYAASAPRPEDPRLAKDAPRPPSVLRIVPPT